MTKLSNSISMITACYTDDNFQTRLIAANSQIRSAACLLKA